MHRPTIPALAALVLAAIAFPVLPEKLAAQTPDPANAGAFDPPDKVYSTGGLANDPAVDRSLPKIPEYRAFLPETVDLSNRMPAVGDQGQLGSCGAWAVAYAARSYYTETQESRDIRTLLEHGNDAVNVGAVIAISGAGQVIDIVRAWQIARLAHPVPAAQLADLQKLSCARVIVEARGDQSVLSGCNEMPTCQLVAGRRGRFGERRGVAQFLESRTDEESDDHRVALRQLAPDVVGSADIDLAIPLHAEIVGARDHARRRRRHARVGVRKIRERQRWSATTSIGQHSV
jgi:hypothetical protein